MKRIYLTGPYTDKDKNLQEERFQSVCRKAGELMCQGHHVYSLIVYCHSISRLCALPEDWLFWRALVIENIEQANELLVLKLKGWRESTAVTEEIKIADNLGKSVVYLDYL